MKESSQMRWDVKDMVFGMVIFKSRLTSTPGATCIFTSDFSQIWHEASCESLLTGFFSGYLQISFTLWS